MALVNFVHRTVPSGIQVLCSRCNLLLRRQLSSGPQDRGRLFNVRGSNSKNRDVVLYSTAGVLVALAASYAAVPLYRLYCQSTGKGGKAFVDEKSEQVANMKPVKSRLLTVVFQADTESQMAWDFKPTIKQVKVSSFCV